MPRKRSRSVSSKQSLSTDNNSNSNNNNTTLTSPTINSTVAAAAAAKNPTSPSFFTSPRLFLPFSTKTYPNSPTSMNSTSVSEANPFSTTVKNPFFSERKPNWSTAPSAANETKNLSSNNGEPTPVGLGLVDALNDEKVDKKLKQESRMVLFGSPLRIQIPPTQPMSPPPPSPIEFGVKNKSSQLALYSPVSRTPVSSIYVETPRHFVGSLSPREMELSEDYTCVITRGPNPRTTHIFDNCIVVKCNDGFVPSRKENDGVSVDPVDPLKNGSDGFLSFCHACKKSLGQGKDIFMYRFVAGL